MGPGCGQWIGDLRYVGPVGHAPQNLCFECWMAHWSKLEARAVNGGRWTRLDEALWLVCGGLSLTEAAGMIDSSCTALRLRINEIRRRPELTPDWLEHIRRTDRSNQN